MDGYVCLFVCLFACLFVCLFACGPCFLASMMLSAWVDDGEWKMVSRALLLVLKGVGK